MKMRMAKGMVVMGMLCFGFGMGCGRVDGQTVVVDGAKVVGGEVEESAASPSVVALLHAGDSRKGTCTGTFVSEQLLLTAAHCVPDPADTGRVVDSAVTLARSHKSSASPIVSGFFVRHPHYRKGEPFHDLALVRFERGTAPAVAVLASKTPGPGDAVTFVGFGRSSYSSDGKGTGLRQRGSNEVALIDRGETIRIESVVEPGEEFGPGQSNLNTGDSGGPLFDREGRLAGVSAWVTGPRVEEDGKNHAYGFFANLNERSNRSFLEDYLEGGKAIPGKKPAHGHWAAVEPPTVVPFCLRIAPSEDGFHRELRYGQEIWCRNPDAAGVESNLVTKRSELPSRLFE